jgi:thiol-disulfide isomerase/thioredoxin
MPIFKIFIATCILSLSISLPVSAQDYNSANAYAPFQMTYFKEPLPVPPVQWYDENGRVMTMEKYRGKVVLLNVWATWCAPCVHEMPSLDKLQRRYKKAGLEVVAVASQQTPAEINQFFIKHRIRHLDIYVDPTQSVGKGYKTRTLPTSYLISRKGEVVAMLDGAEDWFSSAAQHEIEKELKFGMIVTPPDAAQDGT